MFEQLLHTLHALDAVSAPWGAALWRATWQGGLALILVLLFTRAWRTMPPVLRVWLWRAAFVKVLLALVWGGTVPVEVPRPVAEGVQRQVARLPELPAVPETVPVATTAAAPVPVATVTAAPAQALPTAAIAASASAPVRRPFPWRGLLMVAWVLGVAWGCGSLAVAWRQTRGLQRGSRPLEDAEVAVLLADLAASLRLRVPPVRVSEQDGPLVLGCWRPTIILPATLISGDRQALRMMLAHELAHLRHGDLRWGWLATLGEMLCFFHPLVRWGAREWALAQEIACDTLAVRATRVSDEAYSAMLVNVSVQTAAHARPALVALGVSETFRNLSRRIRAMAHRPRLTWKGWLGLGLLLVVLGAAVLVPWQLATRGEDLSKLDVITFDMGEGIYIDCVAKDGYLVYYRKNTDGTRNILTDHHRNRPATPERFLGMAIEFCDARLVRALLERDPSLMTSKDPKFANPLGRAIDANPGNTVPPWGYDRAATVRVLLEVGADPNKTHNGRSYLHTIASLGDLDTVRVLVEHGAKVNVAGPDGTTPLYWAVASSYPKVADYLRSKAGKMLLNASPFFTALAEGNTAEVEQLLKKDRKLANQPGGKGTPLEVAIDSGKAETVALLLQQGARVDQRTSNDELPIVPAIRRGDLAMVRALIDHGAEVNYAGKFHPSSSLMQALYSRGTNRSAIFDLLLEQGAEVTITDGDGENLLHAAVNIGDEQIVRTLLKRGLDVNARDMGGRTPLHLAARSYAPGQVAIAEILLQHKADVSAKDSNDTTPIGMAAHSVPMQQLLVRYGAKPRKNFSQGTMVITPDGGRLVTAFSESPADGDDSIPGITHFQVYDMRTGTLLREQTLNGPWISTLLSDGRSVLTSGAGGTIERLDVFSGRRTATTLPRPARGAYTLTPDGKAAWAVAHIEPKEPTQYNTLRLYDLATGAVKREFVIEGLGAYINPKGDIAVNAVLCNLTDKKPGLKVDLCVWDLNTGKQRQRIPLNGMMRTRGMPFSPDGSLLVVEVNKPDRNATSELTVFDTATWKPLWKKTSFRGGSQLQSLAISPDNALVAVEMAGRGYLYDINTGKEPFKLPEYNVGGFVFSPDGTKLVVSMRDIQRSGSGNSLWHVGPMEVYDVKTGKVVQLIDPQGAVAE